jgi:hypothetical protein
LAWAVQDSRTAQKHCGTLLCADISAAMLQATHAGLGDDGMRYVKLDGIKLSGVRARSIDVCFCFDTMVHMEPRDIFNYLTQIPALMRGSAALHFSSHKYAQRTRLETLPI